MFSVSQTTITSDWMLSACARSKNAIRLREPTSSSPSTSILTLTGRLPRVLQEGGDGAELGGDGPLVVGGAAAEEPAVARASASTASDCHCSSKLIGCTSWWA